MQNLSSEIVIYDASNIDQLPWPRNADGEFAQKFLTPLVKEGVHNYFDNIQTKMLVLTIDDYVLPITINESEYDNSWVCSLYGYYIGCGLESLSIFKNSLVRGIVRNVLKGLGVFFKLGKINKVVSVNNWLFSTNLHPPLSTAQIRAVKEKLAKEFPGHAIIFRSVNSIESTSGKENYKDNHFHLIACRQIFHTNPKNEEAFTSRIFKSDLKLLRESPYQIVSSPEINQEDAGSLVALYNALNVDKYSKLNPQINSKFLKHLIDNQVFSFSILKKEGKVDGVVGHYSRHGVMTCPFFGYNQEIPQQVGLYRILSTLLALAAKDSGKLFHQSSGASFYKSVRRAQPSMEYTAVFTKHLPLSRRLPWLVIKLVMNHIGIVFMKKY